MKSTTRFLINEKKYLSFDSPQIADLTPDITSNWCTISNKQNGIRILENCILKITINFQSIILSGAAILSVRFLVNGKILENTDSGQLYWPAIPTGFQDVNNIIFAIQVRAEDLLQVQFYSTALPGTIPSGAIVGGLNSSIILQKI